MFLEFETQVPDIADYSSLIALCVDIFSQNTDRKFKESTVSVAIVDEDTIQRLNFQYRNQDKVTDVLSFSLWEDGSQYLPEDILGDIVICYQKAKQQAQDLGHSIEYELAVLCLHGLCHLVGYDHQTDDDYHEMQEEESKLLDLVKKRYSFS